MKDSKVVGKIFQTKNYSQFKYRADNRPVDQANVHKLVKSFEVMGQKIPIKVDSSMNVLDGQHRLKACVQLKMPVVFIIDDEDMTTSEIAQLQATSTKWNYADYAHSFATDESLIDYRLYNNFCTTYSEFPHSTAILMLSNLRAAGGNADQVFKSGKFKIKSFAKAKEIAETLRKMSIYYKSYNRKGFVSSVIVMMNHKDFSQERLFRKLPKRCKEIHDFSKTEDYLDTLQDIYNWKEPKKVYFH
jgi:hypothetical protein